MGTNSNYTGVQVIGAGLSRTGTRSTKTALEYLLKGRCYHLSTCLLERDSKKHLNFWEGINDGSVPATPEQFREMLIKDEFKATIDYPCCKYYQTLMEAFPNAKVVLTVRKPEKWYRSVRDTIYQIVAVLPNKRFMLLFVWLSGMGRFVRMARGTAGEMFDSVGRGQTDAVSFYQSWMNEVKSHVPPERLLVFSAKEGWGPLCQFLDLPVPEIAFPNVNDGEDIKKRIRQMKHIALLINVTSLTAMVGVLAITLKYIM